VHDETTRSETTRKSRQWLPGSCTMSNRRPISQRCPQHLFFAAPRTGAEDRSNPESPIGDTPTGAKSRRSICRGPKERAYGNSDLAEPTTIVLLLGLSIFEQDCLIHWQTDIQCSLGNLEKNSSRDAGTRRWVRRVGDLFWTRGRHSFADVHQPHCPFVNIKFRK
jgi:hypothetical protein